MPPAPLRPYLTQVESKGSASKPPTPLNPPAGATAARTLSAKRNGTGSAAAAASARVRRAIFQDDDAPDATEIERHAPAAAGSLNPRIEAISPSPRVSGSLHESPLLSPVKTAAVTAGGGATTVDGGGGGGDGGRGNAESLAARMPSVAGMVKGQAAAEEEREGTDGIGFGVGFGVGVDGGVFGGGTAGREGARSGVDLSMRELMEHAMLSAIATKMGLPENDSRVREVFHRESRRMAGGGGATGGGNI